jgi:hypothetical protein
VTKVELVEDILKNNVYQPDSGLVRNLKKALTKLSYSDLSNLRSVILCKVDDALEEQDEDDPRILSVHADGKSYYGLYSDGELLYLLPEEVEPSLIACRQKKAKPMPARAWSP